MKKIGYTDRPVEKVRNDSFGIKRYIEGLCNFIVSCETPMTISIQGDWGSGKTSMMNMIKERVDNDVYSVWFNTWQYSQFNMGNDLSLSFLENLISKLQSKGETVANKALDTSLRILKIGAKTAISTIGLDGGAIVDVFEQKDSNIAKAVQDLKKAFQKSVNDKIKESGKNRMVVFVDDLDRLNPSKAVELLEVLKVFLDCENCIFILAIDYNVVTTGVKQKFGEDIAKEKGKSFFDKIIQLPFKMPVAQYDITEYVRSMLTRMNICVTHDTINEYTEVIRCSIGFNPRSIKRLFNTYQLITLISGNKSDITDEQTRQRLLFASICMQMSFDELYTMMITAAKAGDLTGKLMRTISDSEELRHYHGLPEELGLLNKDHTLNEEKLLRISSFMHAFINVVDTDKSGILTEDEIEELIVALCFSSVTSVSDNVVSDAQNGKEQARRVRNKEIAQQVDILLADTVGDFNIWQPRKATNENRFSDTSIYIDLIADQNVPFTMEFTISSKSDEVLSLVTKLFSADYPDELKILMSDNPLDYDNPPTVNEQGYGYKEEDIKISEAVEKLSDTAIKTYDILKKKGYVSV